MTTTEALTLTPRQREAIEQMYTAATDRTMGRRVVDAIACELDVKVRNSLERKRLIVWHKSAWWLTNRAAAEAARVRKRYPDRARPTKRVPEMA